MRSNGPFPQQGFITQGDVSVTNLGLFLQDSWTIGRNLTLNLGLRTENEKVPTFVPDDPSVPQYAIEWGFGKKLAPRIGFAWDVQGDGKTKVYGSWGVFYDIFKLELPLGSFGGDEVAGVLLHAGQRRPQPDRRQPELPAGLPRHPAARADRLPPCLARGLTSTPDLKPMQMQEFVFGAERELASNLSVSARWVHK